MRRSFMIPTGLLSILLLITKAIHLYWEPAAPLEPPPISISYAIYRAPLNLTFTTNDQGLEIPDESCGDYTYLGTTFFLTYTDIPPVTLTRPSCYRVATVTDFGGEIGKVIGELSEVSVERFPDRPLAPFPFIQSE